MSELPAPGTVSPADGSPLEPIEWTDPGQIAAVVDRARAAQVAWAALPLKERGNKLVALAKRILERRDEVASILAQETGRDEAENLLNEVVFVLDYAKGAVSTAKSALAPEKVWLNPINFPGKRVVVEAVPRGVIGIIEPWNYPLLQFYKPLFPALLAGNGLVLKPSEHAPRTGLWLARQCAAVLGEGLVGVVVGGGEVGSALIDGGVDAVVFCGSVATGRKVAAHCGERLIPCSVELGGKDAAIVLSDCDLERTVAGIAQWAFNNAGQDCSSIERIYVEDSIADTFVQRLAAAVKHMRVAPTPGADIGPLQNKGQLEIVKAHVADAVTKGAVVVAGGEPVGAGYGFQPTVLDHCTEKMDVIAQETFGPVAPIIRVKTADEAVERANRDSVYGLGGSVWTRNLARGEELARRLEVGLAYVNNHAFLGTVPQVPWTGVGDTGPGVAASRHSFGTFVRRRTVLVDKSTKPDVFWRPANSDLLTLAHASSDLALGAIGKVFTLLPLLGRRVKAIQAFARGERES